MILQLQEPGAVQESHVRHGTNRQNMRHFETNLKKKHAPAWERLPGKKKAIDGNHAGLVLHVNGGTQSVNMMADLSRL